MFYKRKLYAVFLCVVLVLSFVFSSCAKAVEEENDTEEIKEETFVPYVSVNFIDLSYGESVFILFSDGKSMLIDCGRDDSDGEKIRDYLEKFNVKRIDYLVLTHPDGEHVGGAEKLIKEFDVGRAYIPKVVDDLLPLFPAFGSAISALDKKEVETVKSECYKRIKEEDYAVVFLSPISGNGNPYSDFNMSENPTAKQADNVSPIIYLEIQGVRFVFTGDAGMAQEQAVLDNIKIAFYQAFIKSSGIEINFDGIDFLKMSDGGSNSATSAAFAKLLKAKNAVVFSGDGRFPDNSAIHNLWNANNDYKLWRTDVYGTISVKIDGNGLYSVITEREQED